MKNNLDALRSRRPDFVFDLDSTITKCELLPVLARSVGLERQMAEQTEAAMCSMDSFEDSFRARAALLNGIPLSSARAAAAGVPLNEQIVCFLKTHASRCIVMTGNLDVWIEGLLERIGMQGRCLCSEAIQEGDVLTGIRAVLDKAQAARRLRRPFVAIGDGSNDAGMLQTADLGIAFGGVRAISEELRRAADLVICDEGELCRLLESLL